MDPATVLAEAGSDALRSYEDAATAIGRLDAAGTLAAPGLRELLILRCAATGAGISHTGMIALAHPDGEGDQAASSYAAALRDGAARARGGVLPSVALLHELLRLNLPAGVDAEPIAVIDELLRDAHARTPPLLKAAIAARAIREFATGSRDSVGTARLVALAVSLILCVGGAMTDAWLTVPSRANVADDSLRSIFAALAREARSTERGLAAAQELRQTDAQRVRDSLGRAAYSALEVLALLADEIVITVPDTSRALGLTPPTAGAAVARLVELGIAREITGKSRSRAFAYAGILAALAPESPTRQ